tara:strand:- start:696 stop:1655 length:960 start_codon:yes stop_codon:yes gene_type:complete
MKVLGINTSHNPSICQLTDGKIDFHIDETRIRRDKYFMPLEDDCFFHSIDKLKDKSFDGVIVASYDRRFSVLHNNKEQSLEADKNIMNRLQEQLPNCPFYFQQEHHLYHALAAHTYSKNKESLVIVMDGGGAQLFPTYKEMESIYLMNESVLKLYSKHSNIRTQKVLPDTHIQDMFFKVDETDYELTSEESSAYSFCEMAGRLGMLPYSEGKIMGMSAYGHHNLGYVEEEELLSPADKALRLQNKTFNDTIELIKHATTYSDCKNIVLSGGYALNCVNNYRYLDEFPKHNFFVDPNPGDSGTSTGAAIWLHFYLKAGGF